jgi:thiol-disulfide isomerase/thioredoxin
MPKKYTKKSKRPFKRYTKKHRYSTAGKILPPLDVRSSKHLKEFEHRLKKGPITIVLVYADWCGHCHTMMPHFDAASKSPNRTIQSVKVNEQMLNSVNDYINRNVNKSAKPIEVEGYPSIILVNNKGDKISDIEPVRDTSVMTKVMNQSGNLAEKSGFTAANVGVNNSEFMKNSNTNTNSNKNNNKNSNKNNNRMKPDDMLIRNENTKNNNKNMNGIKKNSIAPSPLNTFTLPKETDVEPDFDIPVNINKQAEELVNVEQPVEPPTMEGDMVGNENNQQMMGGKRRVDGRRGGSLIGSISQAAYTLATPAVLMATAAYVMKNSKKTRRVKKHKRHSSKRKMRR